MLLLGLLIFTFIGLKIAVNQLSSFTTKKDNIKYLIAGHSIPECAYNDLYIDNSFNIANSGESYFYTYLKLKYIFSKKNDFNTVFIEFTNNLVSKEMDNWIWGKKNMEHKFPKYFAFTSIDDLVLLLINNPKNFLNTLSLTLKHNLKTIIIGNLSLIDDFGGYLELDKTIDINKINTEALTEKDNSNYSKYNIEYLKKIIELCHVNGIKIILIRSPLHEAYRANISDSLMLSIKEQEFSDLYFIDFADIELEDTDFADLKHLNKNGAEKISKHFNSYLHNKLEN